MIVSGEKARRELGWKPRCAKAVEVVKRQVETVPRKLDRRLSLLFRAVDRASRREPPRPDLAGYETTIHLELSGPDEALSYIVNVYGDNPDLVTTYSIIAPPDRDRPATTDDDDD